MPKVIGLPKPRTVIPRLRPFVVNVRTPRVIGLAIPSERQAAPGWWQGTLPEWWVYHWLKYIRKLREGADFRYQTNTDGGRRQLFGSVLDFLVYGKAFAMAWRVQGYYWHFAQGFEVIRRDQEARERLERHGFTVIDFIDRDLEDFAERDSILSKALDEGIQYYTELPIHK